MPLAHCPKCQSTDTKAVHYLGTPCILCLSCGFDERDVLDIYPEEKGSQKAKGRYSPYKTGGKSRTLQR